MIIRSQNKTAIINLDNIDTICVVSGEIFYYNGTQESKGLLGAYSTEEKAVKVLDMIQNKYFEHMTLEQNGAIMGILEKPKVFLMPEDSEV